jgi:hypothetical protein
MNPAKTTLYAAIGAGTTAFEKARELPQRVAALPTTLSERVNTLRTFDVKELPNRVQSTIRPVSASELFEGAKRFADRATDRFVKTYTELSKRGETFAKKVRKAAPSRGQARTARPKKAAAKPADVSGTLSEQAV